MAATHGEAFEKISVSRCLDYADAQADSPLMEAGMDSPDPRPEAFAAAWPFHTFDT